MKKNKIIIGICIILIATTSLLASSTARLPTTYEKTLNTLLSIQNDLSNQQLNQQETTHLLDPPNPIGGRGGGFGLVGDTLVSTYEWGSTKGKQTQSVRLGTSEYYLIASNGDADNDLYLTTIHVENDNGNITNTTVDSWEIGPDAYMQSPGTYLCHVTGDIYAITYQHNTSNNILKSFSVSSTTGIIQKTAIDTFTLSNRTCSQSIIQLTSTLFVIASQKIWDSSNTGYLETVYIDSSGGIGSSVNDTQQFANYTTGLVNPAIQLCAVDNNTIAIIYTGYGTDGYVTTYNISSTGVIQDINTSMWEFDTSQAITPNIVHISGDYFALVYSDSSGDGQVRVFRITSAGVITKSWVDSLEFDAADCWYPQITYCGDTSWNTYWYAITYRGTSGDGFVTMIEITKSGYYISDLYIDRLEFDTLDCQWTPSLLFVNETYYLIVYPGNDSGTDGSDGWAATVNLYTNNQPPLVSNPSPANQAISIDSNPLLQAYVDDDDKGGLAVSWYTNTTGSWVSFGSNYTGIDPTVDIYEYDTANGQSPEIIRLGTSEYYLVAYAGSATDGYLATLKAYNTNGTIKKQLIDTWEYDTTDGIDPSLVHITDDIYAVAYRDTTDDRAKVFTVKVWDENGTIQKSMIDVLSLSKDGNRLHLIKVSGQYYAVAYTEIGTNGVNATYDGFIETIRIDGTGAITDTVISTAEFDTGNASYPRLLMIDSDTILICYQGTAYDGFIRTYNISSLGVINNITAGILEYDPNDGYYPTVMNVGVNRYAITYRGTGRMYIRTIQIADTGAITSSFTDSLTFNYFGSAVYIRSSKIIETENQYLIVCSGYPTSQLIACTVNISQDGLIDDEPVDKTRIIDLGTSLANFVNIVPMGNGYYLLVYEGSGSDGYVQTIGVNPTCSDVVMQHNSNFNQCGTKYWWRVDVSDGIHTTSQTYSFTTQYAPNANNDVFTVEEDSTTPLTVLTNDYDPEGHTLTVTSVTDPQHGTTSTDGSTVTYSPNLNYNGPDLFTYTISDGHGGTDSATVSITVTPLNDSPTANNDTATVTEDSSNNQINVLNNDGDIDGDSLTITGITQPVHGTATYTASYVLYTPSANYNGPDSFTYTISDGHGGTDTATVSVTVTPVNDAPVAVDDTATVSEDSTGNQIDVLANDYDIDGDPISITGVTLPTHGTVTYTISTVFYTPNPNYNGVDSFSYTIIDGYGGTDTATVTVSVTPVNDLPDAVDDTATVAEDSNNNQIDVLNNDNDIDSDSLSIIGVSTPTHGTTTFTASYAFYSPSANYNGPDSFTYTISDGHGGTDTATVSITVTPVNDLPVANDDTATVVEDSFNNIINVLANDIDIDGDSLTITSITQPTHGSSTFSVSSVIYTPAANYSGSDSFTYTINDGHGGTDTATIFITITPVNDQPIAVNDTATVPEDSSNYPINARINDIDVDGDVLTIVSVTQPDQGIASTNGTRVFYTPFLNYYGSDSLTYTISDGQGGTDTATIFITVTSVNDAPVAVNDTVTVAEDSTNNLINAVTNDYDVENNPLTIISVTQPLHGSSSTSSGFVFYTPSANYNGQDSFTYTISDGNGGTATGTIFLTITPMNDAPNANNDTATVAEDSSSNLINVLLNDNDPDGDTLSIASVTNPPHGTSTTNGNYVFYTPDANYFGTDTFSYTMSDGHGGTDTATITITVAPISDPPVAVDDTLTVAKNSTNNQLNVLANDYDPDNNPLIITSVTTPLHGTASTNGLFVFYTPTVGYTGSDTCSYTISDGTGYTDTAIISLTVAVINNPPIANDDTATVVEDSSNNQINVLSNDNDPNSDPITIISVTQPPNGMVTYTTTFVTYTPDSNYHGSDSFTYTISDGGSTDSATVTVTVTSVNDVPVAVNDTATVSEDSSNNQLNVQANDIDDDGDALSITAVTTPAHGLVSFASLYVLYTPTQNYFGTDSFVYTISDSHGGTDTATVTVIVTAVNDPPTAVDDTVSVNEDSTTNQINVRANDFDVDGDSINITAVIQPAHGSLTFTTAYVYYTPAPNYFGVDSFTYTVNDGHGSNDVATVTVSVLSVNDPPVAGDDTVTVIEDSTNNQITVQANDNDVDGDPLIITAVTQPPHGSVTYTTQYVYYTPAANYFGSDSFSYTISDGNGGTDIAVVFITITGVNDPPVAGDDTVTVIEDSSGNQLNVRGNDYDPDNNSLSIVSITVPDHGTVTFTATYVYYTPQMNYAGSDSFTYTIADGQGGTDVATVTVTVTPLNDPPVANDDTTSVVEDSIGTQINVRANDVDIDGDTITITSITQPTHGSASYNSSYVFYTPTSNYNGFDSLTYTISDGHGSTDSATVTITVTPVNDAPNANNDTASVAEDSINNLINVLANDVDPDYNPLTVTSVTVPGHGTTSTNGVFIFYTPAPDYVGFDAFSYTINDAQGGVDTATVSITITQVNDAPNAVDDSASVIEDSNNNQITVLLNDNDIDGDTLIVTAVTQPSHGLASFSSSYVFYTPQSNYNGADSLTYTISDGHGGSDTAVVSLLVTPLNDPPIANNDTIPVLEDSSNNQLNVLINDIDIDGDQLTITGVTQPSHGSATFTVSYVYYTPSANYNGQDSLTYTIDDGHGGTDTAVVTITVTSQSDPPVAVDDNAIAIEDSSNNIINVLANDYDPENDLMLITSVTQPIHGTSSTNGAFVFYTPVPNYNGADGFSYTISDGGNTDSANITISITAVNDAPSANDDIATVAEDSNNNQINVLLNDIDIDGNPLTVVGVTQPAHGSVTFSPSALFYTPQANYVGADSFTYTASDGLGGTDTALVTVTVTNINDPPSANDDTESVVEDSMNNQIEVLVNDYDSDGDLLTITGVTQPSHGSATFTVSYVYYTPSANYNGQDSLTYTINDGHGGTDTATIIITVTSANDPPVAYNDTESVTEDSSGDQLNVLSNDVDPENNPLFIISVTQPVHGTSSTNGAFVFYTPSSNYHGSDVFNYSISDGNGGTDSAVISVSVSAINDFPNAVDDTATVAEDSSGNLIDVLLNDNDPDGDTLVVVSVTQPSHGSVTFTSAMVSYTPALNYYGPDSFTYSVSDGHGGTDTASVSVLVTGVNDAPNAVDDTVTVAEDSSNNQINVRANDVDIDGDALSIISITQPSHGSATFTVSYVYYTPSANYNGQDSLTYTISDGFGGSDTATVFIAVSNTNDPPVANNDTATVNEDSSGNQLNVLSNDVDPENNPLFITSVSQPVHGTSSTNGAFVFYTPSPNYHGSDVFNYSISDGNGGTDSAVISVSVSAINDFPNAVDDTATVAEDLSNNQINVLLNDNDPDGDTLVVVSVTQPSHGSVTFTSAMVSYTPALNYYGPDSFTYSVSDGHGGTDTASVSVLVTGVNDAPNAVDDTVTVAEDSSNNQINVRANDVDIDGDALSVVSVTPPSHGVSSTDGVSAYYTPTVDYVGPDSFMYTVSDGFGGTDTATVFVTVSNVNDPPVANNDTATVIEDSVNNFINVLSNDFDPESNTLTIISVTQPTFGISSTNSVFVFYTPLPNYYGSDSFTYTISDGIYADTAFVFVTVTPVNDAPVVTNIPNQTIAEGSLFTAINLDDYVSDLDNNDSEMTWTYSGNVQLSISIVNRVATITTPNPDWFGSETVYFKATDTGGLWDNDPATFSVTAVNDPPIIADIPNQTIAEGSSFTPIMLDAYVSDVDNADSEMIWTYSGNVQLSVSIVNRVATITTPNIDWIGSETVVFRAADPSGLWDNDSATFAVSNINDPPVVSDIPNQTIAEGSLFTAINLDDYVSDLDNNDSEMTWTYSGNVQLNVSIVNRVAAIVIPSLDWFGSETILFTATDPSGLWDNDSATFAVSNINDPPVVSDIPNQTIAEGSLFTAINLDDYVSDVDNNDSEMTWTYSGNVQLNVSIVNRVAVIAIPSLDWFGSETVVFRAADPSGLWDNDSVWLTVTPINDSPIFGIPVPANGSTGNQYGLVWSIPINDPEGNSFNWTIQCSNGQGTSGAGASNGTKTLTISGLVPSTSYRVWVNATDPLGSGLFTRNWYLFTTKANLLPTFGSPTPANGSTNRPLSFTWSIPINDPEGNPFEWTIQCTNGQTNNGTGASNGTKSLVLSGLTPTTTYKVWVNATDPFGNGSYTRRWYIFTTTGNFPPSFGSPTPANGTTTNHLSFAWRISIVDSDGDLFSWTIQCSNGQSNSGANATNGTKSLSLYGLEPFSSYIVWVNATDPTGSTLFTRRWYTFNTGENFPPELGIPVPANGSTNTSLTLTWSILLSDPEGDLISWSIQCSNGQSSSGENETNGTKSLSISGLASLTTYVVWVNATDPPGVNVYNQSWYTFTTEYNLPPFYGNPVPANGSTNNSLSLTWSISINDTEGDLISWSILCSNGQTNHGTGATNGTRSIALTGLAYFTEYTVWVNASDPLGTGMHTIQWYTFTTKEFVNTPPEKPSRPTGKVNGEINVSYTYTSKAYDVDGGSIWLWFNWGDGTNSGWVGPFNSNSPGTAEHMWLAEGSYNITVKAKDYYDAESVWSDPLAIIMPVEINYVEGKTNLHLTEMESDTESDTNNTTTQTQGSNDTTVSTNVTEKPINDNSANEQPGSDSDHRNIFDLLRLIHRIFRGENPGMSLMQILRTEGWI